MGLERECKLCRNEIKGPALTCCYGTICMKCAGDINMAKMQPMANIVAVLWILSETFFRKSKGEEISFEQVWNENKNSISFKLIKFEDYFELDKNGI